VTKIKNKRIGRPEDACYNEVNMGRWVLCLSRPVDHLFDARRKHRSVYTLAHLHTCFLTSRAIAQNACDTGCSRNVTDTRAVCPQWSATTHASPQFIGCLSASQRHEEHVTATRLARLCGPRLQASAYLCSGFV